MGFKRAINDPCIYHEGVGRKFIILALYADDLLIFCEDLNEISLVKVELQKAFEMTEVASIKKFVGMNIDIHLTHTKLHLEDYVTSLLRDYSTSRLTGPRLTGLTAAKIYIDFTLNIIYSTQGFF